MSKKSKKSKKSRRKKSEEEAPEGGFTEKSIDEQLDEVFDDTWDDIEPRSFEELPDGTYQTRVLAAVINNAQSSGRLQCSWELIVVEGDHKGRHIFIHQGMDTEDGIAYFKGSLGRLGYDEPKSKKELVSTLREIVGGPTYCVVRLSTRKRKIQGELQEVQNKRFVKALDSDEVDDDFEDEELTPTMGAVPADLDSEPEPGKPEEEEWSKGDQVKVKIEGEHYEGAISKLKEETALVKFDDGDLLEIPFEDLEEVKGEKETPAAAELPPCELSIKKLTPSDRRAALKLAKEHDFKVDDFDIKADLLCEIGDYCGLTGKFKNPVALIKAIKVAANA